MIRLETIDGDVVDPADRISAQPGQPHTAIHSLHTAHLQLAWKKWEFRSRPINIVLVNLFS